MIHVFTDGGSRGNPGPGAYGVFISKDSGEELTAFGQAIGISTNNVAEYMAVIEAYNWLLAHRQLIGENSGIKFFMDSELVYSQLTGKYKVKHPNMKELYVKVKNRETELALPVSYFHIPREKNKQADSMVNKALDNLL